MSNLGWSNALIVAVTVIWITLWALRRLMRRRRRRTGLPAPDHSCQREWYADRK
jgi:hypothetical protein